MFRPLLTLLLGGFLTAAPWAGATTAGAVTADAVTADTVTASVITVSGSVTTTNGAPLAAAHAELVPILSSFEAGRLLLAGSLEPPAVATVRTDSAGRYELRAPGSGVFKVVVRAPGFVPMQLDSVALVEPREIAPVALAADRGARVRIVDASGRPRAGLWLWAESADARRWRHDVWLPQFRAGRTDSQGWIMLPRAAGEGLALHVLDNGAVLASRHSSDDVLTLRPVANTAPRSLHVAGQPEASSPILVRAGPLAWPVGFLEGAGLLRFQGPIDAPLTLWLVHADGHRQRLEMPAAAGGEASWPVTPRQPMRFAGRLLDGASRQPLAGALVWLGADPGTFARTDAAGRYHLAAPTRGRFWLQAEAAGYRARAAWVSPEQVEAGQAPTLGLTPAVEIRGHVLDASGTPLPGAHVIAIPRRRSPATHADFSPDPADSRAQTGVEGAFTLTGLWPGRDYDLQVSCPGYATARQPVAAPTAAASEATASSAKPADKVAATAAVGLGSPRHAVGQAGVHRGLIIRLTRSLAGQGRVIDDQERPVAGAVVILTAAGDRRPSPSADGERSEHRARSDAEGRFVVAQVPATVIDLTVFRDGFAPLVVRGVEVPRANPASGSVDLGTVVLAAEASLAGRVVDPNGEGIADVPIFAVPPRVNPEALADPVGELLSHRSPNTRTDGDGGFRLTSLRPGDRTHLFVGGSEHVGVWVEQVEVPIAEPLHVVLEPGRRIAGRVIDSAGEGIAGAELELEWQESLAGLDAAAHRRGRRTARSNADGGFVFSGLQDGPVTLTAWATGFQESEPQRLDPSLAGRSPGGASPDGEELVLVLERGATLRGQVTSADGTPLDAVRVTAGRPGAFTDAEGAYRLDGVTPGAGVVKAYHPHHGALRQAIEVEMGDNVADLTFPEGFEIRGQVVDEAGHPLVEVALELDAAGRPGASFHRVRSAADGRFRAAPVVAGEYRIRAHSPGWVLKGPKAIEVGDATDDVRVVLERGARITGTVLGLDFDELTHLQVSLGDDASRDAQVRGRVDYTGAYEIDDVPPGYWVVRAVLEGGARQVQERLEIPAGGVQVRRDLSFAERFTLSGTVLLAGEALPAARVSLTGRELAVEREVRTDHLGRFRIEDLEGAVYNLGVSHSQQLVVHNRDVELGGDHDLLIDLSPARLSGRIVDAGSGLPLADALAVLVRLSAAGEETNALTAASDAEGAFDFPRVPPGSYRLRVDRDGYAATTWPLELHEGATRRDLELEMQPTPGAELDVRLATGVVPRSITVAILDAEGREFLRQSHEVASDGSVRLPTIPHGVFQIVARSSGSTPRHAVLEVPGEPLALVLEPAGLLEVRVPDLASSDAVATLELLGPDQQSWVGLDPYGHRVAAWRLVGGRTTVEGVPAGPWSLRVTAGDGQTWHGTAATVAGTRTAVELR